MFARAARCKRRTAASRRRTSWRTAAWSARAAAACSGGPPPRHRRGRRTPAPPPCSLSVRLVLDKRREAARMRLQRHLRVTSCHTTPHRGSTRTNSRPWHLLDALSASPWHETYATCCTQVMRFWQPRWSTQTHTSCARSCTPSAGACPKCAVFVDSTRRNLVADMFTTAEHALITCNPGSAGGHGAGRSGHHRVRGAAVLGFV